ncbi:Uncharacterised protein [Segatella copri]|nr:Uncharacterised protein [Segatella copri]
MSRLPAFTTICLVSFGFFQNWMRCRRVGLFLRLMLYGISPRNGMVMFLRSFLPLTVVFMFSRIKMTTTGIRTPRTKATRMMLRRTGCTGLVSPVGGVMMRVL